jgi:hypothetical protein
MTMRRWLLLIPLIALSLGAYRAQVLAHRVTFCQDRAAYFAKIANNARVHLKKYEDKYQQEQDRSDFRMAESYAFDVKDYEERRRRWLEASRQPWKPLPPDLRPFEPGHFDCALAASEPKVQAILNNRW